MNEKTTYIGPYIVGNLPKETIMVDVRGCKKCQSTTRNRNNFCVECGNVIEDYTSTQLTHVDLSKLAKVDEIFVVSEKHHYSKKFDGKFVVIPNQNVSRTALSEISENTDYAFYADQIDPISINFDIGQTAENHRIFLNNLRDKGIDYNIIWGIIEYYA